MTLIISRSKESHAKELDDYKATARGDINSVVELARRKHITPIAGQELMYIRREDEAKHFLAENPEPTDLRGYPFIRAKSKSAKMSAYEAAQIFLNMAAEWDGFSATIEEVREAAVDAIEDAATKAIVDLITSDFEEDIAEL